MTNSTIAKATMGPTCAAADRRAPRRHAIGSNISAANVMRPQATTNGETSSTASLMKKYGTPQMIPSAANAVHDRHVTATDTFPAGSGFQLAANLTALVFGAMHVHIQLACFEIRHLLSREL